MESEALIRNELLYQLATKSPLGTMRSSLFLIKMELYLTILLSLSMLTVGIAMDFNLVFQTNQCPDQDVIGQKTQYLKTGHDLSLN